MTIAYTLTVETAGPVHCGHSRGAGAAPDSLPYIPGSTLRGALASLLLREMAPESAGFAQFANAARVGSLLPPGTGGSVAAPLSMVSCSREPGFLADGGDGVADTLLLAEALALRGEIAPVDGGGQAGDDARLVRPAEALLACTRQAGERRRPGTPATLPWRGFLRWQDERPRGAAVAYERIIWQPLSSRSGTSIGPATFVRALAAGQQLAGRIVFPDADLAEHLVRHLAPPGALLWVGSGRSRGLGQLVVRGWQPEEQEPRTGADQRAGLADRLGQWCEQLGSTPPDATYLTLTLRSPAIVRDPFGRFRAALDGDTIGGWCDQAPGALEVRQAFVTTTAVEGWNSALGLPKPDALALAAGSCWLLRVPPGTASDVDTAMERLEQDGIGERRQEGFGAVACCDPVHWRINELELERVP